MDKAQSRRSQLLAALNGDEQAAKSFFKKLAQPQHTCFTSFIDDFIFSHGLQRSYIIREAGLDYQYGYKILNGSKHTHNRNIIIRICIAMKMGIEDAQTALKYYDMRLLDATIIRDEIIILGIDLKKSSDEIDLWLQKAGESRLFDNCT